MFLKLLKELKLFLVEEGGVHHPISGLNTVNLVPPKVAGTQESNIFDFERDSNWKAFQILMIGFVSDVKSSPNTDFLLILDNGFFASFEVEWQFRNFVHSLFHELPPERFIKIDHLKDLKRVRDALEYTTQSNFIRGDLTYEGDFLPLKRHCEEVINDLSGKHTIIKFVGVEEGPLAKHFIQLHRAKLRKFLEEEILSGISRPIYADTDLRDNSDGEDEEMEVG